MLRLLWAPEAHVPLVILIVGITLREIFLINTMNLFKQGAASRRTL